MGSQTRQTYCTKIVQKKGGMPLDIDDSALEVLSFLSPPGNVFELANILERQRCSARRSYRNCFAAKEGAYV